MNRAIMEELELKARGGYYERQSRRSRNRKPPDYFTPQLFDREAKECNTPSEKRKKERVKRPRFNDLDDSDSDASICVLKKKYVKGRKRFGLMRGLEREEISKSNEFLASDDDEHSGGDLNTLLDKANELELLHGEDINNKLLTNEKEHEEKVQREQLSIKSTVRSQIRKDMKKANSREVKGATITNNNYNISINNTGATFNNTPGPLSVFKSMFDAQRAAYQPPLDGVQNSMFDAQRSVYHPPQLAYQSQLHDSHEFDQRNQVIDVFITELSKNSDNREWIDKYRIALEIHKHHGSPGLRRGYYCIDLSISDWLGRQRREFMSLNTMKQYLINLIQQ